MLARRTPLDSNGRPIGTNDRVNWRGKIYTIRSLGVRGALSVEFEEPLHVDDELPEEHTVSLVLRRCPWCGGSCRSWGLETCPLRPRQLPRGNSQGRSATTHGPGATRQCEQQSYDETWRCTTCGWTTRVVMITLTSLEPTVVGTKEWGTCRGACNSTGALPERHLELVSSMKLDPVAGKLERWGHAMITDEQLARLQRRAHVHDEGCYGSYEPCGEHHVHDDACGSHARLCRTPEDGDLRELVAGYHALEADYRRIEWLAADASRLEDVRSRVRNEGVPLRDAIDWLMTEAK